MIDNELKAEVSTSMIVVVILVIVSLLGIFGVQPLKHAKQPTIHEASNQKEGVFSGLSEFMKWRPFASLYFFYFFKITNASFNGLANFYLAYCLALDRDELAKAYITIAFIGLVLEVCCTAFCAWYFGRKSKSSKTLSVNPRWYVKTFIFLFFRK